MGLEGLNKVNDKMKRLAAVNNNRSRTVGRDAVAFFKQRFAAQNWIDNSTKPWKKRKNATKKNKGRKTLVQTGALRRSIRVVRSNNTQVLIGSDLPYAKVHNEGYRGKVSVSEHKRGRYSRKKVGNGRYSLKTRKEGTKTVTEKTGDIKVKAHTKQMNMPKRQFMGNSSYLKKQILRNIRADVQRILKS